MAYTQCFFQQHALTIPVRASPQRQVVSTKRKHIVCKAEKEDVEEGDANTLSLVSRRSALTAIVGGAGAAAGGTQLLPAHAAVVADVADAQFSRDSALTTLSSAETPASVIQTTSFNRNSFPPGFVFGSASSAYQFEGAANEGGRAPSTWDYFTHNYPEKIRDRSNGDVAVDHYHRFKEDIQIMKEMNLDAYRFSISWSRLLPTGKVSGGINQEGIKFYNKIIDELLANGIQPYVTIFHWDASLALEQEYKGFLSRQIVDDYRDYAELCFREFGDRVKHWITVNEPYVFSVYGYANGAFAPGRCSEWLNPTCLGGDSGVEPYIVAHNILLAHAEAVNVYRKKYQDSQKGVIGITLISHWFEPYSESKADKEATSRAIDFMIGWYMEPVTSGKYPACMRELVGDRLPKFTAEEAKLVAGSFDFIGVNYYTTYYAAHASRTKPNYMTDADVEFKTERDGIPIGPQFGPSWLFVVPRGIGELLQHIDKTYNHPVVYITENGLGEILSSPDLPVEEALIDTYRIDYYYRHLYYVNKAISAGVKVKGYFAWSLLDNFEWADGFVVRFGLNFVDYKDNLKRYAKLSAVWFKSFLQKTVKKLYY